MTLTAPWQTTATLERPARVVVPSRLPNSVACLAAVAAYLVVAELASLVPAHQVVGTAAILAVAGVVGWLSPLRAALGVGALGWLFYSGFVTHTHGHLGIVGTRDAVVAIALVLVATTAVGARALWSLAQQHRPAQAAGRRATPREIP